MAEKNNTEAIERGAGNQAPEAPENEAQNEVIGLRESGWTASGSDRYKQIAADTARLQGKDSLLPVCTIDCAKQPEASGDSINLAGLSPLRRADNPRCEGVDPSLKGGRKISTLDVQKAGLPPLESSSSLSTVPVWNQDEAGNRTLVTTAHGMVNMEKQTNGQYKLLDLGFRAADTSKDGVLQKAELQKIVDEFSHSPNDASLTYQAQYVLNNYDAIAAKSKELNPKADGVTNEGLAQYYMENARVTIQTADGRSIPAQLVAAERSKDIAIIEARGLSTAEQASLGPNFEISKRNATQGESVVALGQSGGTVGAESRCYVADQMPGIILSSAKKDEASVISGQIDSMSSLIKPGMSGGPVIDSRSNSIIGLNHAFNNKEGILVPASSLSQALEKARQNRR